MATVEQKQDLLLKTVKQDIQFEYFICMADRMGFMSREEKYRDFMDVMQIELVADKLSYTGYWKEHYALFACDN